VSARAHLRAAAAPLSDTVEQRLGAIEEQLGRLADAVAAMGTIVGLALDRQRAIEVLVDTLRADLECAAAPRRERARLPCPLSSRELDVLIGLSDGKVYKQIARELSLSASTVRSHAHHTYRKLDVADRAQAVLLAAERGWI
jgi:DNA-binding NarL/FixJ family response regulator